MILGDDPVVERAPIVDLWLKAARRAGAEVVEAPIGDAGPRRREGSGTSSETGSARERTSYLVGPRR